jgi:Pyruvate/2-oxoacid:ferredoxin oxidoreductase delta subunit
MPTRKIIKIDEELCNGCGQCVTACAEAALEIVDGKARLVRDLYCDGLGACLSGCPTGALEIIQREAEDFDEHAALARAGELGRPAPAAPVHAAPAATPQGDTPRGCPGAAMRTFKPLGAAAGASPCACSGDAADNDLAHWPVQVRLVPADAPFLRGADLVVAADCAPVALRDFHDRFVQGRAILIGCPKFDGDADYAGRFADLFARSGVRSVTVLRMEVPCCAGLPAMVREGLRMSNRADIPYAELVVGRQGGLRQPE